jgi:DNA (cytosine-5)-methyltransferase 1
VARGGYTRDQGNPEAERLTLEGLAEEWMAPVADDTGTRTKRYGQGGMALSMQVTNGAAPQARDHFPPHTPERIAAMKALGHGMRNLNDEASQWESPGVALTEGSRLTRSKDRSDELLLTWQAIETAKRWPAPAARDHKGSSEGSITRQDGKSRADMLDYAAEQFFHPPSSPAPAIAGGSMSSTAGPNSNQPSVRRKLNPIFVEALMRWPTGLSGFARPATALTRWQQLMLSYLSALASGFGKEAEQMDLFS